MKLTEKDVKQIKEYTSPYAKVPFIRMGMILTETDIKVLKGMNIYYQVNPPVQSYNENGGILAFLMHLNNIKANGGENNSPETVSNLIYQYEGIESKMKLDKETNNFDVVVEATGSASGFGAIRISRSSSPGSGATPRSGVPDKICSSVSSIANTKLHADKIIAIEDGQIKGAMKNKQVIKLINNSN